MTSFQACFDSWDMHEGKYHQTFGTQSLTVEQFQARYGRFYDRNNGTSRSNAEINARVKTEEFEVSKTRIRSLTVVSGELRSLTRLIAYLRSGYPLAVSYYVVFCYDDVDCISSSVFAIENLQVPGSFALTDIQNKMNRYETITPRPCRDRSITVVLRELL